MRDWQIMLLIGVAVLSGCDGTTLVATNDGESVQQPPPPPPVPASHPRESQAAPSGQVFHPPHVTDPGGASTNDNAAPQRHETIPTTAPDWIQDEDRRYLAEINGVRFSFIPPPDWHVKRIEGANIISLKEQESTPRGVHPFSINFSVFELQGTLDDHVAEAREFNKGRRKVRSFVDEPFRSQRGLQGHIFSSKTTEPGFRGGRPIEYQRTSYVIPGTGIYVNVTGSSPENIHRRYDATLKSVVETFRFED